MRKLGIILAVLFFGLMVFAQDETVDINALLNRIELLEEYTNMIYDTVGTKLSVDDFEAYASDVELRLSNIETDLLNVKNTVDTGLPALRDMLYELSSNLAALEERLTSYVEISVSSLQEQLASSTEFQTALEDLKVTLDIHDSDILKIYETLGTLSEQVAAIQEKIGMLDELEPIALKLDMHDQDIVNIYDNLSAKADREQVDMLEASLTELFDSVSSLNDILTGLAAQIGDTDYLLRKQINDLEKNINTKLADYATKADVTNISSETTSKINALNEKVDNINMIAWLGVIAGILGIIIPFVRP
ncbi:MAG: hypothetical protein ACP5KD_01410 [Fervidobacterium sp.]